MRAPTRGFAPQIWATPLTVGSFILMAATGILMFFDIVPGYVTFVHEWFSWLFLLGAAGHAVVHFRALKHHLKSRWGWPCVAAFTTVVVLSTFSFGRITAPQLKWPISEALLEAPLSALAAVTRTEPEALVRRLERHGIAAAPGQNPRELAAEHGLDEFHVLGLIVLPE